MTHVSFWHDCMLLAPCLAEAFAGAGALCIRMMTSGWACLVVQVERMEAELKEKAEQVERLDKENAAANMKITEMQTRMDCKEEQHAHVIATMTQSQEMHNARLKELEKDKDEIAQELRTARNESEELSSQLVDARNAQQAVAIELRMAEAQMEQASKSLQEKAAEAEDLRAQMAALVQARAELAEAHAVVQAEFAIFKEQASMPKQIEEQIERLCKQQSENKKLEQTVHAKDSDLLASRAQVEQLQLALLDSTAKLAAVEHARRKIFNELQELKGNIRVFCRIRPASRRQSHDEGECPIALDTDTDQCHIAYNSATNDFKFDRCFGQDSTQEAVFEEVLPP